MNEIQGVRNTIPRWLGTRGRVLQVAQHQATHASCLGAEPLCNFHSNRGRGSISIQRSCWQTALKNRPAIAPRP